MSTTTASQPLSEIDLLSDILLAPLMVFLMGGILGFIGAYFLQSELLSVRETIALIITASWVVSLMADIVVRSYHTTIYVHGMMGGVVGYLFGVESFPFVSGGDTVRTTDTGPEVETIAEAVREELTSVQMQHEPDESETESEQDHEDTDEDTR